MTGIEYEVLKRHDVYVVRMAGTERYFMWRWDIPHRPWWGFGGHGEASEFRFKWRAIMHAKYLERLHRDGARHDEVIRGRKSAKEERVWR